jgi:hypothetical protein
MEDSVGNGRLRGIKIVEERLVEEFAAHAVAYGVVPDK